MTSCEVYIKKGTLNGVDVESGDDYCTAIGLVCMQMFDDDDSCGRGDEYSSCSYTGSTTDHIVRCGLGLPPVLEPTLDPQGNIIESEQKWVGGKFLLRFYHGKTGSVTAVIPWLPRYYRGKKKKTPCLVLPW